jgi:hypothetical protein
MSEARIVTIANRWPQEDYYCYKSLFKSVGNSEILVLGQEQGEYTGLSDKPRILYNAIKDGKITEKYIVFVDAFDIVFAGTLENIMSKFKSFNVPIVIGAERNCFPQNFQKEYDRLPHTSSYKYLNSGVIVGETEAILEVLEAMDAPNLPVDYHDGRTGRNFHFNDQAYYMDLYLRQPVKMLLDYNCEIAQNMQDVTMDDIELMGALAENPKDSLMRVIIKNKETGKYPSIVHWNGGSKSSGTMQPILKHLNLL